MSDIYDYTYMHIMRPEAVEINTDTAARVTDHSSSIIVVNTMDFSHRDLQLFVDSMEAISRLEKIKHKKRQSLKIQRRQQSLEKSAMKCTSLDEDAKSSAYTLESNYSYDDTAAIRKRSNSTMYSNTSPYSLKSLSSIISDESGVFVNTTTEQEDHIYEEIDISDIRPRSIVITNPKYKSLKSRLVSLIIKKQYVKPATPVANILSSTTYGEDLDLNESYDRVMDDVIQQQFTKGGTLNYRMPCKRPPYNTPEEKFLDKAMSFINLSN